MADAGQVTDGSKPAKQPAPPYVTGGGGFVLESQVTASVLAAMLGGVPPDGLDDGVIREVSLQVRPNGWLFDDVLLTLEASHGGTFRVALSVKSDRQFGLDSPPESFVNDAWRQYLHEDAGTAVFDRDHDYLALATSELGPELHRQLHDLLGKAAAQDPDDLATTVAMPKVGSDSKRKLLAGFACPSDLAVKHGATATKTGTFLRRLRFLEHDFDSVGSKSKRRAVGLCRALVESGTLRDAVRLWRALVEIADELRPRKGTVRLPDLIRLLRGAHRLKDYPEYGADFERLRRATDERLGAIRDAIGDRITLVRRNLSDQVDGQLAAPTVRTLIGSSGSGKTGLAKRVAGRAIGRRRKVIWVDVDRLNRTSLAALEAEWRLEHPLPEIMAAVPEGEAFLILDGLEKLSTPEGFAAVGLLIRSALDPWRVVGTCAVEEWERIRVALAGVNVPAEALRSVHVRSPSDAELSSVWSALPGLRRVAARHELRELLLRLKILDLFARNLQVLEATDAARFAGESDLVDWFWRHVVDRPPDGPSRAVFARLVATRQADELSNTVPEDELAPGDIAPLAGLCADAVCCREDGRLRFDHDLYGDWTRRQVLIAKGKDFSKFMSERASNPVWNRAVRLYALHLLETKKDLEAWRRAFGAAQPQGIPTVTSDVLLEAVLFAADPSPLLEQLWPALIENNGALLVRLLARFRHTASVPNPLFPSEPEHRIPNAIYWPPIIRFIRKRMDEVAAVAPLEVADIVDLWLRQGDAAWPCRREAAEMSLRLAKRALRPAASERYRFRDAEVPLYRAVLAASADLPNEVRAFVLDAAGRTGAAEDDEVEAESGLTGLHYLSPTVPPPSSPDGPRRRVDPDFARVCHEWQWVRPLIMAQPAIAREIVLATIISPSSRCARHGGLRHEVEGCAANTGREWYPPFWHRGPFYAFLKLQRDEGLEVVLRLINFVTERWHYEREAGNSTSGVVEVYLPSGRRTWAGDADVYYAYRDLGRFPDSACCALMALEKYFYDEIDAGRSVADIAQAVMDRAASVAFAGVLSAVGHKQPALFETVLRPLLGVAEFQSWEYRHATLRHDKMTASISWSMSSPATLDTVREWINMPHREKNLFDTASRLFLSRVDMRPFFDSVRQRWEERRNSGETLDGIFQLDRLIAFYDLKNYRAYPVDGGVAVEFVKPEGIRSADEKDNEERRVLDALLMLPMRCARVLEEGKTLTDAELEELWKLLQEVESVEAGEVAANRARPPADTLCGGVAVLFLRHRSWLRDRPDRDKWCRQTIERLLRRPPAPPEFDSCHSKYPWGWDRFLAQVVPVIWAEDPSSTAIKELVARVLFNRHYESSEVFFKAVAPLQAVLGDEYWRLWHLALRWSALRWRAERAMRLRRTRRTGIRAAVNERMSHDALAFTNGTLAPSLPRLTEIAARPVYKNRWDPEPRVDMGILGAMLRSAPLLDAVKDPAHRVAWLQLWHDVVQLVAERATPANRKDGGTSWQDQEAVPPPYDDERHVLEAVARTVIRIPDVTTAESLWKPLMALPDESHHWIETFIEAWLTVPIEQSPIRPAFRLHWARMAEFVRESPAWVGRTHERAGLRQKLLGIGAIATRFWSKSDQGLITGMAAEYELHVRTQVLGEWELAEFCTFLSHDCAAGLVPQAIRWIAQVPWVVDPRRWSNEHAREQVCRFLALIWEREHDMLRGDPFTFEAFRALLAPMVVLRDPAAMELQDRLARGG